MTMELFLFGFGMGTFKFLFSQWLVFGYSVQREIGVDFFGLLIPTIAGAWTSMGVFYFGSGFFMKRAAKKRRDAVAAAIAAGKPIPFKRKFTGINKFVVRIKMNIGIHAVTFIAPLILSIPIGSIVCAKFYRDHKYTFLYMMGFSLAYAAIMSTIITFTAVG